MKITLYKNPNTTITIYKHARFLVLFSTKTFVFLGYCKYLLNRLLEIIKYTHPRPLMEKT